MLNDNGNELSEATCDMCFSSLTDAERKCVDLVAQGYLAKEIARRHDISVHSVNKIVREVRRRLGPLSNGVAVTKPGLARAYRAWIAHQNPAGQESQRIGSYSAALSGADNQGSDGVLIHDRDRPVEHGGRRAKSKQAYLSQTHFIALLDLLPLPTKERARNDMDWKSVLVVCGIVACMTMFAAGSTASLLAAIAIIARE